MPSIYSYEPNIVYYNHMIKKLKNFSKIKIHNFAVPDFTGKSYLYFHANSRGINDYNYIQGATLLPETDGIDIRKNGWYWGKVFLRSVWFDYSIFKQI